MAEAVFSIIVKGSPFTSGNYDMSLPGQKDDIARAASLIIALLCLTLKVVSSAPIDPLVWREGIAHETAAALDGNLRGRATIGSPVSLASSGDLF